MKIISGGQIGADIAGLRAARSLGIETGGFAPKGYKTLNGPNLELRDLFGLEEMQSELYPPRTYANVKHSQGTVRFAINFNTPGERYTLGAIKRSARPYFDVHIFKQGGIKFAEPAAYECSVWVKEHNIRILNVSGNGLEDIEGIVEAYMMEVLRICRE